MIEDALEAALFRFWVYGASHFPGQLAKAIMKCRTEQEYRIALYNLARKKRINLPAELGESNE